MAKRWRKKGRLKLTLPTRNKMMKAFDLIWFGYPRDTNWYRAWEPLAVWQACEELWFSTAYFYKAKSKYKELDEAYEGIMDSRRARIWNYAEENIESAIKGDYQISDKDKVDFSFRMLEKTNKKYNPKTEIEANINEVLLDMSDEEIQSKILELMPDLWKK